MSRVCLSFPIEGREPPRFVVTGRPLAAAQLDADARPGRAAFGLTAELPVVLVFGGSQGAQSLNRACLEAFGSGRARPAGAARLRTAQPRRDAAAALAAPRRADVERYRLLPYTEDLAHAMAAADLVVGRAGGSVAEIAALGRPAVLVPYPYATADHQSKNAAWMAAAGAAVVVADADLDGRRLAGLVGELLADRTRLARMAAASRAAGRPDATRRVADEVEALLARAALRPDVSGPNMNEESSVRHETGIPQPVHFIGVGGAGMSGIAAVLAELGVAVTGSDLKVSRYTRHLAESACRCTSATTPRRSATPPSSSSPRPSRAGNPELQEARRRGLPVLQRAEMLARIMATRRGVAVAGTHGKTTTSSMITHVMLRCDRRPTFLVGGDLNDVGSNAGVGEGEWLVAEADESDGSLLFLRPELAVVTNVELDHHANYRCLADVRDVFRRFVALLPPGGRLVAAREAREPTFWPARPTAQRGLGTGSPTARTATGLPPCRPPPAAPRPRRGAADLTAVIESVPTTAAACSRCARAASGSGASSCGCPASTTS